MSLEYEENHLSGEIMIQFYQETILANGSCVILVLLGDMIAKKTGGKK